MKLDLVYNPASGSFCQRHLEALVRAFADEGFVVETLATTPEGAVFSGTADLVCVHGGDGTLRDVVQGLGARIASTPLCIAPAGTINLVARELGYPRDPVKLARQVASAWTRGPERWLGAPLFTLGEIPIVACLSIGPDSHAVAQVSGALKKRIGRLAYVFAILRQMRDWPRATMTISGTLASGEDFACEAEAVVASHGALYGGPFRLSPRAALEANSVELITLHRSTRLGTLALTGAAMLGLRLDRLGIAEIRTVRRVSFDRCVTPVQVDGDHVPGQASECSWAIGPSGMTIRYVV